MSLPVNSPTCSPDLMQDVRSLIEESRASVVRAVNATLAMLHWQIGHRINVELLQGERAVYGKQIVATLSHQLLESYGKGFGEKSLRRMIQFAENYPDQKIVASLVRQLSWPHFTVLIALKEPLPREFYTQM